MARGWRLCSAYPHHPLRRSATHRSRDLLGARWRRSTSRLCLAGGTTVGKRWTARREGGRVAVPAHAPSDAVKRVLFLGFSGFAKFGRTSEPAIGTLGTAELARCQQEHRRDSEKDSRPAWTRGRRRPTCQTRRATTAGLERPPSPIRSWRIRAPRRQLQHHLRLPFVAPIALADSGEAARSVMLAGRLYMPPRCAPSRSESSTRIASDAKRMAAPSYSPRTTALSPPLAMPIASPTSCS